MRPTITLALIAKDEEQNIPRLFESVKDCFDEIVLVDTGSTDKTVELAKSLGARVEHFEWVNDFAAARNYSLSKVKTEYAMWLDLDDVLDNKEAFIDFRDNALQYFDYILANYHYAVDQDLKPIISFARERIFKMSLKPSWNYFCHEGVVPMPNSKIYFCTNWSVKHMRTAEDMAKDKSRNLNIFEYKRKNNQLDGRMVFYYGKELFENSMFERATPVLFEAAEREDLQMHDRVLCLQFACYSLMQEAEKLKPEFQAPKLIAAKKLAREALELAPNRAEFHNVIGDCNIKMNNLAGALPAYAAAKYCIGNPKAGDPFSGAIHNFKPLYEDYPRNKIIEILATVGRFDDAKREAHECIRLFKSDQARQLLAQIEQLTTVMDLDAPRTKTSDIVITCPPQSAYVFDEELYKTKGMGGSETALIEMAKWIKKLTGRRVIVFNMRDAPLTSDSGVEYISTHRLNEYFTQYEPAVHIAWRHNIRLTKAPSYLWCHDLMIPEVEMGLNQDFILALTPFHRDFLASAQGVPKDRIVLTRNGINSEKLMSVPKGEKNPHKVVFVSSPDRGLDSCMEILDIVRASGVDVELHCFYGRENLHKYGLPDLAYKLDKMIKDRPWVKDWGFTEQKKMYEICADAAVWLHPTTFVETFCISALEMLSQGIFPLTRRWGGLGDTLKDAESKGQAVLMDIDHKTPEDQKTWATEFLNTLALKKWERIQFDPTRHEWREVAVEWCNLFGLLPDTNLKVESVRYERLPTEPIRTIGQGPDL